MLDYEVERCSRRCAATGRELAEGEAFYSLLLAEGGQIVRRDYAVDGWPGPPAAAVGWWRSQVPTRASGKPRLAPSDVLLALLEELQSQPQRAELRYLLALLLVRRRIVRVDEAADADDPQWLRLYCPREDKTYTVAVALPDERRAEALQAELTQLLYAGDG